DFDGLLRAGQIVGTALREMRRALTAGMTTAELDEVCARTLARHGARATPSHVYGFPGAACISVNDEVVHGIPGGRVLRAGDVVKLAVTADLDGYVADAARTVVVGTPDARRQRLIACAQAAFTQAMKPATAGASIREVGRTIGREVRRHGFAVVRELTG